MERQTSETAVATNLWLYEGEIRRVWRLCVFILVYLVSAAVFYVIGISLLNDPLETGALTNLLAAFAATAFSMRVMEGKRVFDVGLRLSVPWIKQFLFGLAIASCMIALVLCVEVITGLVEIRMTQPTVENASITLLHGTVIFLLVGFGEEILVRGYPLQIIIAGTNSIMGVFLTSVAFAVLHINNPSMSLFSFLNIFLAGIWLGTGYVVTGSLALPIGMHTAWNLVQGTVIGYPVSGVPQRSIWLALERGDDWITGGSFGPEGGLLATLVLLAGTLALLHPLVKKMFGTQHATDAQPT